MTVLWARWPIWDIRSRTKRSVTSCGDTTSPQHRSGVARRRGRSSSNRMWRYLPVPTFFTVEVLTWRGLVTYYVLFFIEVGSRRVRLGGITRHPESSWMQQVARNARMEGAGYLNCCRYLL